MPVLLKLPLLLSLQANAAVSVILQNTGLYHGAPEPQRRWHQKLNNQ